MATEPACYTQDAVDLAAVKQQLLDQTVYICGLLVVRDGETAKLADESTEQAADHSAVLLACIVQTAARLDMHS